MTTNAKRRGRPEGDGCDDGVILTRIADMMLADEKLIPTVAIRRVLPKAGDTELHRLRRKWRARKGALLVEARDRAAKRVPASSASTGGYGTLSAHKLAEIAATASATHARAMSDPSMRAALKLAEGDAARMAREIANGSAARIAREVTKGSAARAARDLEKLGMSRIARDHLALIDKLRLLGIY